MFLANLSSHANVYLKSETYYFVSIMEHKVVYMYITLAEISLFTLIDMDDERRGMEIKTVLQSFHLGKPAPKRTKTMKWTS